MFIWRETHTYEFDRTKPSKENQGINCVRDNELLALRFSGSQRIIEAQT